MRWSGVSSCEPLAPSSNHTRSRTSGLAKTELGISFMFAASPRSTEKSPFVTGSVPAFFGSLPALLLPALLH